MQQQLIPEIPGVPSIPDSPEQNQYGSGSGFVIDTAGHIVTNAHVVQGASRIEVMFHDGTQARAEIVGIDTGSDVAVIQVTDVATEKLLPITWGNSDTLDIGQEVLAIGSPFNQRWTLTQGIISALDRTIPGLTQFSTGGVIQTDAAINPGNSGGTLLNMAGEVIGVNSQIRTSSGSSSGVGFAIPSNLVQRVANELISKGFVEYSYLGISGGDVSLSVIEQFNLANDFRGVLVSEAVAGGPADRAGVMNAGDTELVDGLPVPQTADIITAINGEPVTGIADLIGYLANNTKPGDTVKLSVLRNGTESLELEARLTPRPSN
jgi:S1-C subfamily serine protease